MNKPIKFWKQVVITLVVPFGSIWAFDRVGKIGYGFLFALLPMAIWIVPTLVIGGLSVLDDQLAIAIGMIGMCVAIAVLIYQKYYCLWKWTKEYNASLEDHIE